MENGVIQNNEVVSDLIRHLKTNEKQYPILSKKQERELIEKYRNKDEGKLRKLLVLHNIRCVFNNAAKQCKKTNDFDEMVARGLYGLVIASQKFNLDATAKQKVMNENGEIEETVVFEEDGKTPKYIKFITYANWWVRKYILDEFDKKKSDNKLRNASFSMNSILRMKNNDTNSTMEDYLFQNISPDVPSQITQQEELSAKETVDIYKDIQKMVMNDNQLSSMEKEIFVDTFYNNCKTKDIAAKFNTNVQIVINRKNQVLRRVKQLLGERYGITSINDIIPDDSIRYSRSNAVEVDD